MLAGYRNQSCRRFFVDAPQPRWYNYAILNGRIRTNLSSISFPETLSAFVRSFEGASLSPAALRAYQTDVTQCIQFLTSNSLALKNRPKSIAPNSPSILPTWPAED